MITLSESISPSLRVAWYASHRAGLPPVSILLSDRSSELNTWEALLPIHIPGVEIHRIDRLDGLWGLDSYHPRFEEAPLPPNALERSFSRKTLFLISTDLLETTGSLAYLRRESALTISRAMSDLTIEVLIDMLIEAGYQHSTHTDELATYMRQGSLVSIVSSDHHRITQVEYFGDEIDSIIELDPQTGSRVYQDTVTLPRKTYRREIHREVGQLNLELLEYLARLPLILSGGDFLPYLEQLSERLFLHFTDFHRSSALPLGIEPLQIEHIDELRAFLSEKSPLANIRIMTRYPDPVREFLSFHQIRGVEIFGNPRGLAESGQFFQKDFLQPSVDEKQGDFSESEMISHESLGISNTGNMKADGSRSSQDTAVSSSSHTAEPRGENSIIIADDILSPIFSRRRSKSVVKHLDLLLQIAPGDFVVHRDHGIGRFATRVMKDLGGIRREYLELHYAEGDKLFVPLIEVYRVSKYIGETEPVLTRLDGREWTRVIEKTDEELELIATELIEIASKRTLAKGISFLSRQREEKEFLGSFEYTHTPDQLQSIREIFADMESPEPMDRLLSGDVGFGKTEVAMNAVYKAVLSGYQVAVISPLLVLADEHFETFLDRFESYGVRIACLTRMTSPREEREILEGLERGVIDVVIGTHRILSEDIVFHRLGLLVIDEEHRFGVSHKERFKKLRANVDILSLSATPIPRSLNLSLSGLKKISILSTPPARKRPIQTIVASWSEDTIARAIAVELDRGGQVIIVHNRITSLAQVEAEILSVLESREENVPLDSSSKTPRIISTHGRLSGDLLEDRIHAFKRREYDILLTTTIIENGVNFLSANTIIILDPETFGLAQLHQLRGRVGRKEEQGYCYLIYRKSELSSDEKDRITTIANHSHLGAGFEIAMRDMEIRGAGEVLGLKQAGKSKEVGLSLYFRILEEKIEAIRDHRAKRSHIKIDLDLSYSISDEYFTSEMEKLAFFREIESVDTTEELEAIITSLGWDESRLMSEGVKHFFLLVRSRLVLADLLVVSLRRVGEYYVFDFDPAVSTTQLRDFLTRYDREKQMTLLSLTKIRVSTRAYRGGAVELLTRISS